MPTDAIGWIWWVFTAVFLALVLGVAVNLITPKVRDAGIGWLQKLRLNEQKYFRFLVGLSDQLMTDPSVVYLYLLKRLIPRVLLVLLLATFGFYWLIRPYLSIDVSALTMYFAQLFGTAEQISSATFEREIFAIILALGSFLAFGIIVLSETAFVSDLHRVHSERSASRQSQVTGNETD